MVNKTSAATERRDAALNTWRGLFRLEQGGPEGTILELTAASDVASSRRADQAGARSDDQPGEGSLRWRSGSHPGS